MQRMGPWWPLLILLTIVAAGGLGEAGAKKDAGDEVVAEVDSVKIKRSALEAERKQIIAATGKRPPNNERLLENLINKALLRAHFTKEGLNPTEAEVQAQIQRLDAELTRKGSSYPAQLGRLGLTAEAHAAILRFELAKKKLVDEMREAVTDKKARAEFDAHPAWYDGSRIRLSQIFIDTSTLGGDPEELQKAKKTVDKCYAQLEESKQFAQVARNSSQGPNSAQGGDIGWFLRKGKMAEALIEPVWDLEVDHYTKPIRGPRGWHIFKVAGREPAYFTFLGCKRRIRNTLVQREFDAKLKELKDKAKVKKML